MDLTWKVPARLLTVAVWAFAAGCGASTGTVEEPSPTPPPREGPAEGPAPAPAAEEEEEPASLIEAFVDLDTVRARPFDAGKMWTFEYPPLDYFRSAYAFEPDSAWFRHARLGSLRLPNCSASFVSPFGLVLTNHHCARESITQVSRPGESLLDSGFYAADLADERPVEDLTVDQLIAIEDVTDDVQAELEGIETDATRAETLQRVSDEISARLAASYGTEDRLVEVEVIALWDGARYSAYVFQVYDDVRLVMAPEVELGGFGGDPDNFTYPRYSLDMSFFRVYDDEGRPLESPEYFPWDETGADSGEVVFIIGNPGGTSRLQTMAQLRFRRKVGDRATLDFYTSRAEVMKHFAEEAPQLAEERDVRNTIHSLLNSKKAYEGIWEGLFDPVYMARKRDAERRFRQRLESDSTLQAEYGGLFQRMAEIQEEKLEWAQEYGAFLALGSPAFTSAVLFRAIFGYQYLRARRGGAPPAVLSQIEEAMFDVDEQPLPLQRALLAARLQDFERYFGEGSAIVRDILQDRTPSEAASQIVAGSLLADSATAARALEVDSLTLSDPALRLVDAFLSRYFAYSGAWQDLLEQEASVASALGRARFEVYGTDLPPDATFSLRIADGVVEGYAYNGTYAPVHTTFFGLYDHYYSYGSGGEWDLPERWLDPPENFDLSKALNFVSTADIIGGNSGSPVLDRELRLVGVVFDGNIQSLPGEYIYDPEVNRSIAVDVRGMIEALDDMYSADRLVLELLRGDLVESEEEADAITAGR